MTAFIGVDDLAATLHLDLDDDDPLAVIMLDGACEIVRTYLGQSLDSASGDTVVLDGSGTDALLLPELPVTGITSVTVVETEGADPTTLTVDTDFVLGDAGILYRRQWRAWTLGRKNVTVVYDHGFDVVPSDVRLVALMVATRLYDHPGVTQETLGTYAASYESASAALTDGEKFILFPHRSIH